MCLGSSLRRSRGTWKFNQYDHMSRVKVEGVLGHIIWKVNHYDHMSRVKEVQGGLDHIKHDRYLETQLLSVSPGASMCACGCAIGVCVFNCVCVCVCVFVYERQRLRVDQLCRNWDWVTPNLQLDKWWFSRFERWSFLRQATILMKTRMNSNSLLSPEWCMILSVM